VRVAREGGDLVCERCELATTVGKRMKGLLGRRGLPAGTGMLIRPASSIHMFFMRFPIDAVFLDRELRVIGIAEHLRPWRIAWRRGAHSVLELAAGEAGRRRLKVGERLLLTDEEGDEGAGREERHEGKRRLPGG
jgi:uncharacterized protein